jgi:hypothetical protein
MKRKSYVELCLSTGNKFYSDTYEVFSQHVRGNYLTYFLVHGQSEKEYKKFYVSLFCKYSSKNEKFFCTT